MPDAVKEQRRIPADAARVRRSIEPLYYVHERIVNTEGRHIRTGPLNFMRCIYLARHIVITLAVEAPLLFGKDGTFLE